MFSKKLALPGMAMFFLAACSGGDVNIDAANNSVNTDNSVTNPGGGGGLTCASFTDADGQVFEGTNDGISCVYPADFGSSINNPVVEDLVFPAGVHRLASSLWIGQNVDDGAAPAEGTGPTLTLQRGATLAFANPTDILVINRGSQIIANGTAAICRSS